MGLRLRALPAPIGADQRFARFHERGKLGNQDATGTDERFGVKDALA